MKPAVLGAIPFGLLVCMCTESYPEISVNYYQSSSITSEKKEGIIYMAARPSDMLLLLCQ